MTSSVLPATRPFTTGDLIRRIDKACQADTPLDQVLETRDALVEAIAQHYGFLDERFFKGLEERYARRLLSLDPEGRYSALVMTWLPGQRTKLHDHGGLWVVECLYAGRMSVCNYELLSVENHIYQFRQGKTVVAKPGEADFRLPPDEHHVLSNDSDEVAVTIHVFGGRFEQCNTFEPVGDGYVRSPVQMELTQG